MVLRGHLPKHECLTPTKIAVYCPDSQEMSLWRNGASPQALKIDNHPSRQHTQVFEKDVPSLSLWSKALGNLSLLCLRGHIIFQVRLSLTRDRCSVSIMTPTRAITPTILPHNFFLALIFNFFSRKAFDALVVLYRVRDWFFFVQRLARSLDFSEPLQGIEACPSWASLIEC